MNKKVPQSPHVLTKEAKFIAVTPFCSYKLASKAKFAVVAQLDKTLQIHFNVSHPGNSSYKFPEIMLVIYDS